MKKSIIFLFLFFTSLLSSDIKIKNILLLHSNEYHTPFTKSLIEGFDITKNESKTPMKLYLEYIDFNKIDLNNEQKWINYFKNKYKGIQIDGIIISFVNAIKFNDKYGDILFENIPKVVYGTVNKKDTKNTTYITIENFTAVDKTVKVALSQNENVKNIYLLGNGLKMTDQLKDFTKKSLKKYTNIKAINIPNLTSSEIKNFLKKIPKDSIVFYCLFLEDKDKIKLTAKEYLEEFSKVSNAPIYSYFSPLLGSGLVGGYVIDSKLLIYYVTKSLTGEKTNLKDKDFSIFPEFDYNVLKKYNIPKDKLPKNAKIINKPINYFKINQDLAFIIILIFISLVLLLIILINKKRKEQLKKELKAKERLLHLKQELESFFELSINLQAIANVNDGKIIQINNASKTMLGFETKELIGNTFLDLVHPDDMELTIEEMEKLRKGEIVNYFENRFKHKNGNYIYLAWSAVTDEKNQFIYATAQNITEHILLQKEKEKKEKLLYQQSKLASMGEMLGNIAHQWRQPLSAITASSTGAIIQKEMNCLNDKELKRTLTSITNTAQYLSQTIEDFRSFFNPSNNKHLKFNINKTIEKTLNIQKSQFISKNIEIITDIQSIEIQSIENEIIQILMNILNNSKDALIKIENEKRFIFIKVYKEINNLIIEIKDNANGIPEDIIEKVFEPYFTTKHQSQGTGIGLYMSQEIAMHHLKGIIKVENEVFTFKNIQYKGAKFTINIPLS